MIPSPAPVTTLLFFQFPCCFNLGFLVAFRTCRCLTRIVYSDVIGVGGVFFLQIVDENVVFSGSALVLEYIDPKDDGNVDVDPKLYPL